MKMNSFIKISSLFLLGLFASCNDDSQEELNNVFCKLPFDNLLIENEADYFFKINESNSKKVNYISIY